MAYAKREGATVKAPEGFKGRQGNRAWVHPCQRGEA